MTDEIVFQVPAGGKMTDEIVFQVPARWLIKIREDGIHFNREAFPDASVEDFAQAFIETLENNYEVTFEKRSENV